MRYRQQEELLDEPVKGWEIISRSQAVDVILNVDIHSIVGDLKGGRYPRVSGFKYLAIRMVPDLLPFLAPESRIYENGTRPPRIGDPSDVRVWQW